jgi:hypothetical protein
MFLSVLVYVGLLAMLAGALCLIRPMRWLRIPTRQRAMLVIGAGAMLVVVATNVPAGLTRIGQPHTKLDEWMPEWQFNEVHSLRIHASPEQVYKAMRTVTADEIFLFRTLTWIRNPRLSAQPENILNPPEKKPILEVAMAGGFRLAGDEPPHETVLLTVVLWDGKTRPATRDAVGIRDTLMHTPGNAVAGINFLIHDEGGGWCTLSTETRVLATDDAARRQFTRYWRVIYPGSWLLRVTWLRAIRARAQK